VRTTLHFLKSFDAHLRFKIYCINQSYKFVKEPVSSLLAGAIVQVGSWLVPKLVKIRPKTIGTLANVKIGEIGDFQNRESRGSRGSRGNRESRGRGEMEGEGNRGK
jgi:hypothetical protein